VAPEDDVRAIVQNAPRIFGAGNELLYEPWGAT
jgi:hypothetical protein